MSDKNKPNPHQEEQQDALAQNGALDAVMNMTRIVPFGPSRGIHFGSTNFEGYELNKMLDIVESANPELLESAGQALVDARDAIKKAAQELSDNLGGDVDWKGEARNAFTDWRDSLVTTAEGIAAYADTVGTQVMAAGSGLASVRKSMPPRDTRVNPTPVKDFVEVEKVETNDEYMAAAKVEKHRQEAINQMYRLASFYTVSAGMMGKAEEPVFPRMPDVGVPPPPPSYGDGDPFKGRISHKALAPLGEAGSPDRGSGAAQLKRETSGDQLLVSKHVDVPPPRPVGTEIDSVGTLPPSEVARPTNTAPLPVSGPNVPSGPVPPMAPGVLPPNFRGTARRVTGPSGGPVAKVPRPAQGSASGTGGPRPAAGPLGQTSRGTNSGPVGRGAGPLGQSARTGTPGQAASRGIGPVGRGVVGGTPKPGGPVTGPVSGTPRTPVRGGVPASRSGSGRSTDGVVGGRPMTGPQAGNKTSRLPRGTVIGGQSTPAPRSTGQRPSQRGVVGGPSTTPRNGQTSERPSVKPERTPGASNRGSLNTGRGGEAFGGRTVPGRKAGNKGSGKKRQRREERQGDASATD